MTATESTQTHHPQLLAGSFIATPVVFFALVALLGPLTHFASYLFLAWTVAAVATATPFAIDRRFMKQFNTSERLAIVAGNGLLAIIIAVTGYGVFGA